MSQSPLVYSSQSCNIQDKGKQEIEDQSTFPHHGNLCYMSDDIMYSFDEESFHEMKTKKPWNTDPYYFSCVKISSMAALKMLQHSMSGGNIEVMGLLQGKILLDPPTFLIMDAFALPVEGTETRVDAEAEGYEHSVQYISFMKSHGNLSFKDSEPFPILGWYHSHPNYGCWLSGIDVNNQRLHQSHEDPFLAIVIDPIRSKRDQRLHIGAFRVLPSNISALSREYCSRLLQKLSNEKLNEYGAHKHEYYELEIFIVQSDLDIHMLKSWREYSWFSSLNSFKLSSELFHSNILECIAKYLIDLSTNLQRQIHLLFSNSFQKQDELSFLANECKTMKQDMSILRNIILENSLMEQE